MVKNHLSRLNAPVSWGVKRKGIKFITRPNAGAHSLRESIPLSLVVTDLLKFARIRKETKKILNEGKIFVNGKVRKDLSYAVGLMDLISIPSLNQNYRVFYDIKGKFKLLALEDDEKDLRLVQIKNKTIISGKKIQLNNSDGTNMILDKTADYKTGDTLFVSLKDGSIKEHIPLKKGARIYLIGGTKRGVVGTLEDTKENIIVVKTSEGSFETAKRYAFVIGKIKTLEA
ncbi:MAG: 30S ribosomal protein S4e [bacterium]|nr:30S ribosomal protein S4e [bacterium]